MSECERDFWQSVRCFIIRYNQYQREKGASPQQIEEIEQSFSKLLSNRDLKEVVINKITSVELKSDYHNLIMLSLLQDLSKWSFQHYDQLKQHPGPLDCILAQTIIIINSQQQYHTIVPKQNQLISVLLSHPHTMENIQQFKVLYRKLKDIKQFYPSSIREHQKQLFLKTIEECIQNAGKVKNIKVIQYIFKNIFNQLEILEETHQFVSQRLKILKKIVKYLWIYHEDILYKIGYLLMKYSYQITTNKHLFNYIIPIYQNLIQKLIQRPSIAPLIIYKHVVINNIDKTLKMGGSYVVLEILLCQISSLFNPKYLQYFMKNYDWNFMQVSICQQSLNILYQYVENRAHEKKVQFQLVKNCIARLHFQIKCYLDSIKQIRKEQGKWKYYELKKKQYNQLIEEMNQKPKKIFKRIQNITNQDIKEATVHRFVKLIKKTSHLDNRSMIDIFSTDNKTSAQLFAYYVEVVLRQCRQSNLQQFMRLFTSNFFLTGESQQIARVMDTITQLYFKHQDQSNRILRSSDATYTFANAILILNTDLHNPKNQQKMSEEAFIKMCKKINDNKDLPLDIIKKTYSNIKKNKINTFRDRGNMLGISASNWIILCSDYESLPLSYYDNEMQVLDDKCIHYFIYDVLSSIIDEKQTAKLELLVQRFVYDDKVFECEIIELIRKIVDKKSHIPLHILQKIMELANFKNSKVNDKILSYYWLAANIITSFSNLIPTNLLCQFLVLTWGIRIELQDNMYLREQAEMKRIKQSIKYITKRDTKKSIMDMFSNFLTFKDSDEEPEVLPNDVNRRTNFKSLSNSIFDIIKYSESHRAFGIDFLINYIHSEESKLFEQFLSCLFLTFNLLYHIDHCQKIGEDLFYQLLGVKESSITKRLSNLGKKDSKLYNNLINYCKFWILKLLLKDYSISKIQNTNNNNYVYLLSKSVQYLQKADKQIMQDLLKEIHVKSCINQSLFETFDKNIKKIYNTKDIHQVQFFYQKFDKAANEPGQNLQKQQIAETKVQPNVNDQKQTQENEKIEEIVYNESGSPIVMKKDCLKKDSQQKLEQFINPDAVIDQVQQQIEQHLKQKANQIQAIPNRLQQTKEIIDNIQLVKKQQPYIIVQSSVQQISTTSEIKTQENQSNIQKTEIKEEKSEVSSVQIQELTNHEAIEKEYLKQIKKQLINDKDVLIKQEEKQIKQQIKQEVITTTANQEQETEAGKHQEAPSLPVVMF